MEDPPVLDSGETSSTEADIMATLDDLDTSQGEESRVLIIATGGTMCMEQGPDGLTPSNNFLDRAMAPQPSFNDGQPKQKLLAYRKGKPLHLDSLRTPMTAAPESSDSDHPQQHHIRYAVLEFDPLLDSSSISSSDWADMATTVKENYNLFDGFVIIHGTDTLAYTASALSFMMSNLGKAVILTGSQAPIFALQSDAVGNLLGSIILAAYPISEVGLFFCNRLYRGNRSIKSSATAFEAFSSPNLEPLAQVSGLGIKVRWDLIRRPTGMNKVQVQKVLDTSHLLCLRVFPGITVDFMKTILAHENLRGLVLETFGMGNIPGGADGRLTQELKAAVDRGVIIVNVSQCLSGFTSPLYAAGTPLYRAGVIFGLDMTAEAALTKLAYLLAIPKLSHAERIKQLSQSLKGEMTEPFRQR